MHAAFWRIVGAINLACLVVAPASGQIGSQRDGTDEARIDRTVSDGSLPFELTREEQRWITRHPTIRVGGEKDWPPFDFVGADGNYQGLTNDYLELLSDRLGLQFDIITDASWSEMLARFKRGELDAIGAIIRNPERERFTDFTDAYLSYPYRIFTRSDKQDLSSMLALNGRTVAVENDFNMHHLLVDQYPAIHLQIVDSTAAALELVSQGHADAYIGNLAATLYMLERQMIPNLRPVGEGPPGEVALHIGVRKNWPQLTAILQKGLDSITAQEHREIRRRWIPVTDELISRKVELTPEEQRWLAAHPVVRFTGNPNWSPFEYLDENGEYTGIVADMLELLSRKTGVQFERIPSDTWDRALGMAASGEVDVISGDLADQAIRASHTFTTPYIEQALAVVMRDDYKGFVSDLYDMEGRSTAIVKGYGYNRDLYKRYPDIVFREVEDVQRGLLGTAGGEFDAFVATFALSSYQINKMGLQNLKIGGQLPLKVKLGLAVRSDWPELIAILNKAIDTLSEQEKHKLVKQRVRDVYVERIDYTLVWRILAIAVLILLLSTTWTLWLRKQKERLRVSEERFQRAMSAVSESIWEWSVRTGELHFTPGLFLGLGYRVDDMPATEDELSALIHPSDRQHRLATIIANQKDPEASDKPLSLEHRLRRADGEYAHVLVSGRITVRDTTSGEAVKCAGSVRNISDQKAAESEVRKLTFALEQSAVMVIITDKNGNVEYVNKKLESMTGYRRQEVSGKHSRIFLSPNADARALVALRRNSRSGKEWRGELLHRRKDGSEFWGSVSISPILGEDGEVQHYISVTEDVTERKVAEQVLRDSEAQLQAILNAIPLSITISAPDGEILVANPHTAGEVKSESPTVVGRSMYEFYADPQDREPLLQEIRTNGRVDARSIRFKTDTGEIIDGLISALPIRYGEKPAMLGVMVNLTDRMDMERELKKARDAAEEANRFKSRFLANMSHEIRTPMNAIVGLSHLALQTDLDSQQHDYLRKIQSSSHALLGIINDILDFSRIEAGRLHIENTAFRLDEVLGNLTDLVTLRAQEKGIETLYSVNAEVPQALVGDPMRIGQILTNLAQNAIKFTEHGEVVVRVSRLDEHPATVRLLFEVTDSGIGIEPEKIPHLFDSFSQADQSTTRQYGGSGLGLSICKQLVELMGGRIGAESVPGQGSRFYFELSLEKQPQIREIPSSIDPASVRVMVVDDNASAREILTAMLESFRFQVSAFDSGQAVLDELDRVAAVEGEPPIDVVLVDWKMPGMDGMETIQRIRQGLASQQAPALILVTANGHQGLLHQVQKQKLDGFLLKPVTPSLLFDTLAQVLSTCESKKLRVKFEYGKVPFLQGRVLLVEDNEINRQVARELIEGFGASVHEAKNGRVALDRLAEEQFDIVLMDIQMPEMDGFEATRLIRRQARYRSLPIVAMTADAMAEDRERCLNAGMNEHIPKPIDPDTLYQVLSERLPVATELSPSVLAQETFSTVHLPEILPGIDVAWGVKRVGGKPAVYMRLLKGFVRTHANMMEQISNALAEKQYELVTRLVHTLRGVAGNLGAVDLEEAGRRFEQLLKQGVDSCSTAEVNKLQDCFNEVVDGLKVWDEAQPWGQPVVNRPAVVKSTDKTFFQRFESMLRTSNPVARDLLTRLRTELDETKDTADSFAKLAVCLEDYDFDAAIVYFEAIMKDIPDK